MYQAGKVAQVVKEMDKYKMDITKIGEARWTGLRMMKERSGYTMILSGREENQHSSERSEGIDGMEATGGKTHYG